MQPQTAEPTNAAVAAGSNQVLTFTLGNETYGVDILRVQEIRGYSPVTRIPQSPAHVLGVLNLRGYFPTEPNRVTYDLDFVMSDGEWKLIRLSVSIRESGK